MTDDNDSNETHYTELREVYSDLINRREDFKNGALIQSQSSARADELLVAIQQIEELLNEWKARDDRDGQTDKPSDEVGIGDILRIHGGTDDEQMWVVTDMDDERMYTLALECPSPHINKGSTDQWSRYAYNDVADEGKIEKVTRDDR